MTRQHPLLVEGIEAAKTGDKATARRLLTRAIRRAPDSAEAWLWLSSALDTPPGRAFCLEKVLSIDPANLVAQRGLAALETTRQTQPPITARPLETITALPTGGEGSATIPVPAARPALASRLAVLWGRLKARSADGLSRLWGRLRARPTLPGRLARLWNQPRFWQAVVICLGAIALTLAGMLAYDAISQPASDELAAAELPDTAESPHPQRTLRPTFTTTALPTDTPLPTDTATPFPTPTLTETPTPSPTPTATLTSTPPPTRRVARPAPTTAVTPTPRPTLPPLVWDPRLTALGVRLEPAAVPPGVGYWRLVEARWSDEYESAGKHTIYIEVLDPRGGRVVGQPVIFEWPSGSLTLPVENRPPPDWGVNFPMFAALGSYSARVGVELSDRVVGMGMGTVEKPDFTIHTCFYLIFRWTQR
ncbi:MAG: hypothetical protein JXM73_12205 [Anaerolineae bacterium]|nr:hypothetical protein [Anaerolineae bacterium]